jgi:hypothetical protein
MKGVWRAKSKLDLCEIFIMPLGLKKFTTDFLIAFVADCENEQSKRSKSTSETRNNSFTTFSSLQSGEPIGCTV